MPGNSWPRCIAYVLTLTAAILLQHTPTLQAQDIRAIRRQDRSGIVLLLDDGATVGSTDALPSVRGRVSARGFRLVNLSRNVLVPLKDSTVLGLGAERDKCPRARQDPYPANLACIELADATLIDGDRYMLYVDRLPSFNANGDQTKKNLAIQIEPIGGSVILDPKDRKVIIVNHSLSMVGRSEVELQVSVNGRATVQLPRESGVCASSLYQHSTLSFRCDLRTMLRTGDVVTAVLVNSQTRVPLREFGEIAPATMSAAPSETSYDTKDPTESATLYIKGAFVRDGSSKTASVQLLWQKNEWRTRQWKQGSVIGSFGPYLDALATTDTTSQGYIRAGVRAAFLVGLPSPSLAQSLGLFVTPRVESDKKVTVTNFIPLDLEFRPGIRPLFTGELFHVAYRVLPSGGFEYGYTVTGDTISRPEQMRVRRWKSGVTLGLAWGGDSTTRRSILGVPAWGVTLTVNARRYWVRARDVTEQERFDSGDLTALWRFNKSIGLALTARDGMLPPLFQTQRTTDLGFAFVY